MSGETREEKVIRSLIEDIKEETENMRRRKVFRGDVNQIINGDVKIAKKEINKLKNVGLDVSSLESSLLWTEAMVYVSAANAPSVAFEGRKEYARKGINVLKKYLQFGEDYAAHYNMALMYDRLGDFNSAIREFKIAEQSSDDDISIDATKNIKRLEEAKYKKLGCTIGCLAILVIFILFLIFAGGR